MGVTLDQCWGGMFVAVGVKGVAKGGTVGAQLIGDGTGAGLLPVAFCSGSQGWPDAWAMNAA